VMPLDPARGVDRVAAALRSPRTSGAISPAVADEKLPIVNVEAAVAPVSFVELLHAASIPWSRRMPRAQRCCSSSGGTSVLHGFCAVSASYAQDRVTCLPRGPGPGLSGRPRTASAPASRRCVRRHSRGGRYRVRYPVLDVRRTSARFRAAALRAPDAVLMPVITAAIDRLTVQ